MRNYPLHLLPLLLLPALAACQPERKPGDIGTSLSTPAALALTGSGANAVLLVSNANFQLEFSSGSLAAIDLSAVDESKRLNLAGDVVLSTVPLPSFSGPIAITPDGDRALITNRLSEGETRSTPDRVFVVDVSDPSALSEVDLQPSVDGPQSFLTVGHDPFGITAVRLPPEGPGRPVRDRAFVANATDGSLSVLNLSDGTYCGNGTVPAPCVDDPVPFPRASEVSFIDTGAVSEAFLEGPGIAPQITPTDDWTVTFLEGAGVCPTPSDGSPAGFWRVEGELTGVQPNHACTGFLYVTSVGLTFQVLRPTDDQGNPTGPPPTQGDRFEFQTFYGDFEPTSRIALSRSFPGAAISGVGAGRVLFDPFRHWLYVSSRLTEFIYVVDARDFSFLGIFPVASNVTGRDTRGMALSPDGESLYVVNRSPNALLEIDPDTLEPGLVPQVVGEGVVSSVVLDAGPSDLALTPDGRYALVTAFDQDLLDVVDLQTGMPVLSTPLGDGPFAITLSPDGTRAYIAQYFSSAIDVVDVDPSSPRFGEVITTIANENYDAER